MTPSAGTRAVPFGNDPAKIARYQAFWNRNSVLRPLVGFSLVGWFPMQEFQACRAWRSVGYVTPEAIEPQAFLDDHLRLWSLRHVEASMPHPLGMIEVSFDRVGSAGLKGSIRLPQGLTGEFVWRGTKRALKGTLSAIDER